MTIRVSQEGIHLKKNCIGQRSLKTYHLKSLQSKIRLYLIKTSEIRTVTALCIVIFFSPPYIDLFEETTEVKGERAWKRCSELKQINQIKGFWICEKNSTTATQLITTS